MLIGGPVDRWRLEWRRVQPRLIALIAGLSTALTLAGCLTRSEPGAALGAPGSHATAGALPVVRREDMLWLERVSFGLDTATVAEYRRLGREAYLDRQLHPHGVPLPAPIAAQIDALQVTHVDAARVLADVSA